MGAADSKVEDDVAADDASNTVVIPEDEVDANNTAVIPPKVDASVTVVEPTEVGADVPAVMIPSEEEVATEKPKTEKRSGATSGRPQNRGPPRTRAQQRPANKGAAKSPNEASSKKRKNHTAKNSAKSPPKKTSSSDLVPVPSVHNGPRSGAASSTVPNPVHRSQEPLHNSASAFLRHQVLPLLNLPLPTKDVTIHDARELEARFAATAAASAIRPPRGGAVSAPPGLRAAAPTFVPLCEQAGAVVLPKFVPRIPGIHRAEDVELQLQAGAQPGVREQPWVLQVPALVGEGEHQQQLHHGGGLVEHAVGPQTPVHHGPALIVEDPGVQRIARGAVHGEVVNPKVFLPLRAHHFPPACGPKELVHQHQTLSHVPGTVLEACSPAFLEQCCPTYQHQTLEARSPTFLEQCCTTDQYCLQHQQHLQYAGASEEELQHAGEERAEEEKLQYSVSGQNGGSRREPPLCPETLALYEHIHSTWSQTQPAQVGEDYCRQWWQEHQQYQQANQGVEVGGQMPSERNHPTIVGNTIVPPGWATVGNTIVPPGWATQPVSTSGASGSWNGQQQSGGFLGRNVVGSSCGRVVDNMQKWGVVGSSCGRVDNMQSHCAIIGESSIIISKNILEKANQDSFLEKDRGTTSASARHQHFRNDALPRRT